MQMANELSQHDTDEMAIPSYLHPNPAMRWMAWRRVKVVAQYLRQICMDNIKDGSIEILDYGCGTGVLLEEENRLADLVFGVDLVLEPAKLLVETWGLTGVTLLAPDEIAQGISEMSIDVIVAMEVLEHIDPIDETLALFRSRLKPDGKLLVSLPTESMLYRMGRRLAGFDGHYHHSNAASIHSQILSAGFKQERIKKIPAPGPLSIYWVVDYRKS